MSQLIDMTGWIMSEHGVFDSLLIVIDRAEDYVSPNGARHAQWRCKCLCGNQQLIITSGKMLRSGEVKSCGCLRKASAQKVGQCNKQYNTYDLTGEFGILYTRNGKEAWFDLEDYDKIKDYCWWYDANGYLCSWDSKTNSIVMFHRLVMQIVSPEITIDHKNHPHNKGIKRDNRKSNLRIATISENQMNIGARKNNTSGKIGVCLTKNNTWLAYIQVKGKGKFNKTFKTYEEAVQWRLAKEIEYFGEYRYDANN